VIERHLRALAIVLSLIVACGFVLFAMDDFGRASDSSRKRITGDPRAADPTPAGEREREQRNSRGREIVDDANDLLLRPFASISETADNGWVRRGVPALLGLVTYGFLLGFASRYAKAHA
jgi:hypothetical protein